jgi:hypothetical protein
MNKLVFALAAVTSASFAQTQVDLRTQAKSIDFGLAPSTRPFQTGTVLPPNCAIGNVYFKSDASAGGNVFGCVALNTWAPEGMGPNTSNLLTRGKAITGTQDEVQSDITGSSGQTTPIFRVRTSTGANLIQANSDGSVDLGSGTGPEVITNQAAPSGSPAAGKANRWVDTVDKVQKVKDEAGNISVTIRPPNPSCGSQGKVVGDINADGTITCVAGVGGGTSTKASFNWPFGNCDGGTNRSNYNAGWSSAAGSPFFANNTFCVGDQNLVPVLQFVQTPDSHVFYLFRLPENFDSTAPANITFTFFAFSGLTGNMKWNVRTGPVPTGSIENAAVVYNATATSTVALVAADDLKMKKVTLAAINLTGAAPGELMSVDLWRDTTASGNYAGPADAFSPAFTIGVK